MTQRGEKMSEKSIVRGTPYLGKRGVPTASQKMSEISIVKGTPYMGAHFSGLHALPERPGEENSTGLMTRVWDTMKTGMTKAVGTIKSNFIKNSQTNQPEAVKTSDKSIKALFSEMEIEEKKQENSFASNLKQDSRRLTSDKNNFSREPQRKPESSYHKHPNDVLKYVKKNQAEKVRINDSFSSSQANSKEPFSSQVDSKKDGTCSDIISQKKREVENLKNVGSFSLTSFGINKIIHCLQNQSKPSRPLKLHEMVEKDVPIKKARKVLMQFYQELNFRKKRLGLKEREKSFYSSESGVIRVNRSEIVLKPVARNPYTKQPFVSARPPNNEPVIQKQSKKRKFDDFKIQHPEINFEREIENCIVHSFFPEDDEFALRYRKRTCAGTGVACSKANTNREYNQQEQSSTIQIEVPESEGRLEPQAARELVEMYAQRTAQYEERKKNSAPKAVSPKSYAEDEMLKANGIRAHQHSNVPYEKNERKQKAAQDRDEVSSSGQGEAQTESSSTAVKLKGKNDQKHASLIESESEGQVSDSKEKVAVGKRPYEVMNQSRVEVEDQEEKVSLRKRKLSEQSTLDSREIDEKIRTAIGLFFSQLNNKQAINPTYVEDQDKIILSIPKSLIQSQLPEANTNTKAAEAKVLRDVSFSDPAALSSSSPKKFEIPAQSMFNELATKNQSLFEKGKESSTVLPGPSQLFPAPSSKPEEKPVLNLFQNNTAAFGQGATTAVQGAATAVQGTTTAPGSIFNQTQMAPGLFPGINQTGSQGISLFSKSLEPPQIAGKPEGSHQPSLFQNGSLFSSNPAKAENVNLFDLLKKPDSTAKSAQLSNFSFGTQNLEVDRKSSKERSSSSKKLFLDDVSDKATHEEKESLPSTNSNMVKTPKFAGESFGQKDSEKGTQQSEQHDSKPFLADNEQSKGSLFQLSHKKIEMNGSANFGEVSQDPVRSSQDPVRSSQDPVRSSQDPVRNSGSKVSSVHLNSLEESLIVSGSPVKSGTAANNKTNLDSILSGHEIRRTESIPIIPCQSSGESEKKFVSKTESKTPEKNPVAANLMMGAVFQMSQTPSIQVAAPVIVMSDRKDEALKAPAENNLVKPLDFNSQNKKPSLSDLISKAPSQKSDIMSNKLNNSVDSAKKEKKDFFAVDVKTSIFPPQSQVAPNIFLTPQNSVQPAANPLFSQTPAPVGNIFASGNLFNAGPAPNNLSSMSSGMEIDMTGNFKKYEQAPNMPITNPLFNTNLLSQQQPLAPNLLSNNNFFKNDAGSTLNTLNGNQNLFGSSNLKPTSASDMQTEEQQQHSFSFSNNPMFPTNSNNGQRSNAMLSQNQHSFAGGHNGVHPLFASSGGNNLFTQPSMQTNSSAGMHQMPIGNMFNNGNAMQSFSSMNSNNGFFGSNNFFDNTNGMTGASNLFNKPALSSQDPMARSQVNTNPTQIFNAPISGGSSFNTQKQSAPASTSSGGDVANRLIKKINGPKQLTRINN